MNTRDLNAGIRNSRPSNRTSQQRIVSKERVYSANLKQQQPLNIEEMDLMSADINKNSSSYVSREYEGGQDSSKRGVERVTNSRNYNSSVTNNVNSKKPLTLLTSEDTYYPSKRELLRNRHRLLIQQSKKSNCADNTVVIGTKNTVEPLNNKSIQRSKSPGNKSKCCSACNNFFKYESTEALHKKRTSMIMQTQPDFRHDSLKRHNSTQHNNNLASEIRKKDRIMTTTGRYKSRDRNYGRVQNSSGIKYIKLSPSEQCLGLIIAPGKVKQHVIESTMHQSTSPGYTHRMQIVLCDGCYQRNSVNNTRKFIPTIEAREIGLNDSVPSDVDEMNPRVEFLNRGGEKFSQNNNNLIDLKEGISEIQSHTTNKSRRELASANSQQILSRMVSKQAASNMVLSQTGQAYDSVYENAITNITKESSSKFPKMTEESRFLHQQSPNNMSDVDRGIVFQKEKISQNQKQLDIVISKNKTKRQHLKSAAAVRQVKHSNNILTPQTPVEVKINLPDSDFKSNYNVNFRYGNDQMSPTMMVDNFLTGNSKDATQSYISGSNQLLQAARRRNKSRHNNTTNISVRHKEQRNYLKSKREQFNFTQQNKDGANQLNTYGGNEMQDIFSYKTGGTEPRVLSALEQPNRALSQTQLKFNNRNNNESSGLNSQNSRKQSMDHLINNVIDHQLQQLKNIRRKPIRNIDIKSREVTTTYNDPDFLDQLQNDLAQDQNQDYTQKRIRQKRNSSNNRSTNQLNLKQNHELQKSVNLLSAYGQYDNFMKVNKVFLKTQGLQKKIKKIKQSKNRTETQVSPKNFKKKRISETFFYRQAMTEQELQQQQRPYMTQQHTPNIVHTQDDTQEDQDNLILEDIESTELGVKLTQSPKKDVNNQASQVNLIQPMDQKSMRSKGVVVKPGDFAGSALQSNSYSKRSNIEENQSQAIYLGQSVDKNESIKSVKRSIKTDKRQSEAHEGEYLIQGQVNSLTHNTYHEPRDKPQDSNIDAMNSITIRQSAQYSTTEIITHDPVIQRDPTGVIRTSIKSDITKTDMLPNVQTTTQNDGQVPISNSDSGLSGMKAQINGEENGSSGNQEASVIKSNNSSSMQKQTSIKNRSPQKVKDTEQQRQEIPTSSSGALGVPEKKDMDQLKAQSQIVTDNQELSEMNMNDQQEFHQSFAKENQNEKLEVDKPQTQKTQIVPDLSGMTSSSDYDNNANAAPIIVIKSGPVKQKSLKHNINRGSDELNYEKNQSVQFKARDSQDSNQIMEHLFAGNSNVDNNDMLRRSSQVSSKTTKTKTKDGLEDKVILKSSGLELSKQGSGATQQLTGVEDKVIQANEKDRLIIAPQSSIATYQMAGVEDKVIDVSQNNQRIIIQQSEAYSMLGYGSQARTEKTENLKSLLENQEFIDQALQQEGMNISYKGSSQENSLQIAAVLNQNQNNENFKDTFNPIRQNNSSPPENPLNPLNDSYSKIQDQSSPIFSYGRDSDSVNHRMQNSDALESNSITQQYIKIENEENQEENVELKNPQSAQSQSIPNEMQIRISKTQEQKTDLPLTPIEESGDLNVSPSRQSSILVDKIPSQSQSQIMITEVSDIQQPINKTEGITPEKEQEYEYYDEEDEENVDLVTDNQILPTTSNQAVTPDISETPMITDEKVDFYGQNIPTQQQVLQMKVDEINRMSMQNQINRRYVNSSQLVIEEITARQEQSEKASKQDSVLVPSNNQFSWSQVSTDQKADIGSKGEISVNRINSSKLQRRNETEKHPYENMNAKKPLSSEQPREDLQNQKDFKDVQISQMSQISKEEIVAQYNSVQQINKSQFSQESKQSMPTDQDNYSQRRLAEQPKEMVLTSQNVSLSSKQLNSAKDNIQQDQFIVLQNQQNSQVKNPTPDSYEYEYYDEEDDGEVVAAEQTPLKESTFNKITPGYFGPAPEPSSLAEALDEPKQQQQKQADESIILLDEPKPQQKQAEESIMTFAQQQSLLNQTKEDIDSQEMEFKQEEKDKRENAIFIQTEAAESTDRNPFELAVSQQDSFTNNKRDVKKRANVVMISENQVNGVEIQQNQESQPNAETNIQTQEKPTDQMEKEVVLLKSFDEIYQSSKEYVANGGTQTAQKPVLVSIQKKQFATKGTYVQSHELLSLQESSQEPLSAQSDSRTVFSGSNDKKSNEYLMSKPSIKKAEQVLEQGEDEEEYYDEEGEEEYYDEEVEASSPPKKLNGPAAPIIPPIQVIPGAPDTSMHGADSEGLNKLKFSENSQLTSPNQHLTSFSNAASNNASNRPNVKQPAAAQQQ